MYKTRSYRMISINLEPEEIKVSENIQAKQKIEA